MLAIKHNPMYRQLTCWLAVALLVLVQTSATAQETFAHAGEYMTRFSELYEPFAADMWAYMSASAHSNNAQKIEKRREELIRTVYDIRKQVRSQPVWKGDAGLRDSTASFFNLCYFVLKEDYARIVNLEAIAEQSYDLMEAYLAAKEQAYDQLNEASARLQAEQYRFADTHRVQLVESEKSKNAERIEAASQVIAYYNRVFLIYFKAFKQEAYLTEAVNSGDVNAMLQNQNTLARLAAEGMATLDTMPDFAGDGSLKEACLQQLLFFREEASDKAPMIIDYFLQKETFERIKAVLDKKPTQERTQEDIDGYNAAVNAYNAAVAAYNSTNEELNKSRTALYNAWNKTSTLFMDKHVP
ncbi:MAG: hypothetical protein OHK0039_17810 [Bacteroidia bacterium]